MKINFYTFKILTSFILLMFVSIIYAQTPDQIITLGSTPDFHYSVDTSSDLSNPTLNDQPNGTSGSTYTWTIEPVSGTVIGTFPASGTHNTASMSDNKATINWANSTPGDYLVKVVEANNGCPPEEVSFLVRIELPTTATGNVDWTSTTICKGEQVTFNISGVNPNSTLHYSLANATTNTGTNTGTVQIDNNGNATVTVTHNNTNANSVTITLEKVVINGADILFTSPNPTENATINIIVTSPIQLL